MSQRTKQAIFIRHGESAANAGPWDGAFAEIPLTEVGQRQAEELARQWDFTPGLIVVSPFLRTQQTAAPTIARFPEVPVETWDIHEFTYWDRAFWGGKTPEEDQEEVVRFWRVADPAHRHGSGAESFADLLGRAERALERLSVLESAAPTLLFTHGHFIQALRHVLLYPEWSARQKMENFRGFDERWKVKNVELVRVELHNGTWRLEEPPRGWIKDTELVGRR